MAEIPNDPAAAAQLLRQWADDPSINHVRMNDADLERLADLLDAPIIAQDDPPKWDDPAPPMPDAKPRACEICGVYPAPAEFCGFGACPNASE